jgi:hypothetical protein
MSQRIMTAPAEKRKTAPTLGAAVVVYIDPAMAAAWLEANKNNPKVRRIDHDTVTKYATDMAAGRWTIPESMIVFDDNDDMVNGYHRCKAIVESGVTVPMYVAHDLPLDAVNNMDTGRRRTLADQLAIAGHQHASALGASARLALAWTTGRLGRRIAGVSDAEVREFITANPTMLDAAAFATITRSPITLSVTGAATWRLVDAGYAEDDVHEFFRSIAEMRTSGDKCPKRALLRRVNNGRAARERFRPIEMLGMVVRAWNAERTGAVIERMHAAATVPDIVPVTSSN